MDLILKNIKELATPKGVTAKKGKLQSDITILNNCMIGIEGDTIVYVGKNDDSINAKEEIDCNESLVTPGLIDAHTHLVFGGYRQDELPLKLEGKSYLEILKSGGGILNTVKKTRAASYDELLTKSKKFITEMLKHGTTTCEAKSGYGLLLETEIKQLQVINDLNKFNIIDVVPTFMGAHAIPVEFKSNRKAYVDLIIKEMLPEIKKLKLAEFCDIFCESEVFDNDETMLILNEAKKLGFKIKLHGDEIIPMSGAETSAKLGCISAEHLIESSDLGIKMMGEQNVIANLLPATSFYLEKKYARAKYMIENNVAVCIATDFNPGSSPNLNLQLPMNLGCIKYKLNPAEVLTAVTLNAAASLNLSNKIGTIEIGKKADIAIWDAPDLNYIFYRYGTNLVSKVIKNGKVSFN